MFNRKIALAAFIAASAFAPAPAQALRGQLIFKAHALNSFTGQKAVAERVERTVNRACYREYPGYPRLVRNCRRELGDQIVAKIGNSSVTARWQGRSGQAVASRAR